MFLFENNFIKKYEELKIFFMVEKIIFFELNIFLLIYLLTGISDVL